MEDKEVRVLTPLDERERLPRELVVRQPWYMRTQGRPVYKGFVWLVVSFLVMAGAWYTSANIYVTIGALTVTAGAFWWWSGK